jgi:signal transduction histidine kinase
MPGHSAKVLICCEPNSGLESIAPQLQTQGYALVRAPSIFRAVAAHSTDPADVVIIDANHLSEKDHEVFDILRESLPGVKLFATISISRRDKTPALLRSGVERCFLEPFYADEMLGAIERTLKPEASPQAAAGQADKLAALGRFARGVAHEINNPLATLSGWVQILVSEAEDDDPRHTTFEVMQQEVDRVGKVVQDLLAFSGQPSPQRDQVDINAIIRGLARGVEGDPVEYATDLDGKLPKVYANPGQLRQALSLIIAFIRTQIRGAGRLQVITQADRTQGAVILLRSTATAVSDEQLNNMFDPFYSNNGDASEGGLGLAISYGIIKGLGGTVRADNEAGELTFTLTVPGATEVIEQSA